MAKKGPILIFQRITKTRVLLYNKCRKYINPYLLNSTSKGPYFLLSPKPYWEFWEFRGNKDAHYIQNDKMNVSIYILKCVMKYDYYYYQILQNQPLNGI